MTDLALATMHRDAEAAFRRQDDLTAASPLGRVLRHDRRDVRARALLAQMAMNTGDFESAARMLNEAIRIAPKNAALRVRLGRVHAAQGGYAGAIAQYDRALKLDPSATEAVAGKAEALERQGRPERALRLLEPLARGGTPPREVAAVHVRCLVRTGDVARAIALGEAATADAEPDAAGREALFALARAHEDAGDCDAAFAAAARANAILAPPYDPDAEAAAVDELIATFSPETVAALPRADVDGTPAVFIVGLPRSGSTLVERILATHPGVHGAGEISAFHLLVARLPEAIGSDRPWPACVRDLGPDHATKRHDRTLSHDQVRRPIYATSVGRADRFADHLGPLRAALGTRAGGAG